MWLAPGPQGVGDRRALPAKLVGFAPTLSVEPTIWLATIGNTPNTLQIRHPRRKPTTPATSPPPRSPSLLSLDPPNKILQECLQIRKSTTFPSTPSLPTIRIHQKQTNSTPSSKKPKSCNQPAPQGARPSSASTRQTKFSKNAYKPGKSPTSHQTLSSHDRKHPTHPPKPPLQA